MTANIKPPVPRTREPGSISSLINLAARLTNRAARIRLGQIGTFPGQIPILLWLLEEEGLLQKDLVERTNIEQSTMAEHLDRMERDALITRVRDKRDGRKYRIYLTETARRQAGTLLAELDEGARMFTKGIRSGDLRVFENVLDQIIHNIGDFIKTYDGSAKPEADAADD